MKVLTLALALCFAAGPVAAAKKPYRASQSKHAKVRRQSKVKKAPKAAKYRHVTSKRVN